jgi:hypothetical protein
MKPIETGYQSLFDNSSKERRYFMQSNQQLYSTSEKQTYILQLIAALAHSDAQVEDVTAQIRNEGLDALDVIVALSAQSLKTQKNYAQIQTSIDFTQFSRKTQTETVADTFHRVPKRPFVLNGTLYDPQDIERFNGQELHLVDANDREPIFAVDNRETIAKVWELTYLSSLSSDLKKYQHGGYQFGGTSSSNGAEDFITFPGHPIFIGSPGKLAVTYFYEHMDFTGDSMSLNANRGYNNLRDLGRGLFGLGDWNDIISSVRLNGNFVCVLHDHIHYQGNSLTLFKDNKYLEALGWNDRTSSIETW